VDHNSSIEKLVSHLFRKEAGKMTAILVQLFGFSMISLAEDIVQDTFVSAYSSWPYRTIPDKPEAWLMQVAKNKAINALKKDSRNISMPHSAFAPDKEMTLHLQIEQAFTERDSLDAQLKLLFLCCHPGLGDKQQVALTLQVLCGFSLNEIAAALLMEKEAVKKMLFRTKQEIKEKGLFNNSGYLLRSMQRLETVQQVLYLMFNEGYKTTESKDLINKDLCYEAIRLGKLVLPLGDDAVVSNTHAMLSLMFFNAARFNARTTEAGEIISLEHQDRSKWDRALISEGYYHLGESRKSNKLSKYHLEAGIAAIHCSAENFEQTNWEQIQFYYNLLIQTDNTPIIALNRTVAVYYVSGVQDALRELNKITDTRFTGHYLYWQPRQSSWQNQETM
jgi:RNA polymerase sigma-70 factor (ECF subfamily)